MILLLKAGKGFFKKTLDKYSRKEYNMQGFERKALLYAPLAQPDRVFGYEPKGRGFESLTARHDNGGCA